MMAEMGWQYCPPIGADRKPCVSIHRSDHEPLLLLGIDSRHDPLEALLKVLAIGEPGSQDHNTIPFDLSQDLLVSGS
jgi:hypothetical protein